MMNKKGILATVLLLLGSATANADVIFENPWDTSIGQGSAWCSSCGTSWRMFDTFNVDDDVSVTQIDAELWLSQTSTINYSIWTADRTAELFSQTFAIGDLTILGTGISNRFVSAMFSGLNLAAGTYSLSIWDLADRGATTAWHAARNRVDGSNVQCFNPQNTQSCVRRGGDQAFRIIGDRRPVAVPEPGTLTLFGLGLLGLGLARRKPV